MFLQAAIDASTKDEAQEIIGRYKDIEEISFLEIGTPLISHYGISILKVFSAHVRTEKIYVDLKVIDFPVTEILPYYQAGIRRFSVMAFMNDDAFRELGTFIADTKIDVFVSTMGYPLPYLRTRVEYLSGTGYKNFICHGSGNKRNAFSDLLSRIELLHEVSNIILIAAGGINSTNAAQLKEYRLGGLIVGRGLANEQNVSLTARRILHGDID